MNQIIQGDMPLPKGKAPPMTSKPTLQSRIEHNEADRIGLIPEMIKQLKLRFPRNQKAGDRFELPVEKGEWKFLTRGLYFDDDYNQWVVVTEHIDAPDELILTNTEVSARYIKDQPVRFEVCGKCKGKGGYLHTVTTILSEYVEPRECSECNGSGYVPLSPEGAVE